jgi:hypothetical protein
VEPNLNISLEKQRVNPAENSDWNTLLTAQSGHSVFHTKEWVQVLADTYGYTPFYFGAKDGEGRAAWLPLMEVNSWLTGRRGVSLPFTDDCEPICLVAGIFQNIFRDAVEFGKLKRWKYIECRGGRELFHEVPASLSFYGHTLNLTAGEDQLFARFNGSIRGAIRKAQKLGVTMEMSQSLEAVKIFYELQCQTRKKHGLPPQPFKFFLNIQRHLLSHDLGMVVLARYQGRPVAGAVYFYFRDRAIFKFGASDEAHQDLRGGNLVMWAAIQEFVRRGMKQLDFGRTSLGNDGLRRFKLGWGTAEHSIDYVKFDLRKNEFVTDRDETSGWHTRVFSRLPRFLSRAAGAALYKHWA